VKEILERQPTKNLVFLDVTRLYTDLMALPGVERVTLRKILPNRLKVVLNQRSPWVRIIAAEEYYIDKEGWVVVAPDRSPELTVKGLIVENNRVQPSEAFKLIIIQELEKWYNYYQVSSLFPLEEIDISDPDRIILRQGQKEIYLHPENLQTGLGKLKQMLRKCAEEKIQWEYIDARFKEIYLKPRNERTDNHRS
ncbi:MAG: FtsQ-type POTRA domain-containing protein, partial [Candidatus Omnitrophica bacterium]|nr:FtsQ-type POTRA domain-containing protein [Candidatus Omnitrophota bacterium]